MVRATLCRPLVCDRFCVCNEASSDSKRTCHIVRFTLIFTESAQCFDAEFCESESMHPSNPPHTHASLLTSQTNSPQGCFIHYPRCVCMVLVRMCVTMATRNAGPIGSSSCNGRYSPSGKYRLQWPLLVSCSKDLTAASATAIEAWLTVRC
jgi:hypothetical protein